MPADDTSMTTKENEMHGITPEPPAGSEHYREGWRNGYEQAQIDVRARDEAAQAEAQALRAELERLHPRGQSIVDGMTREIQRLRAVHEADGQLLRDVLKQNQTLRARDEAGKAVVQAAEGLHLDWVLPEFRDALDALARAHDPQEAPARELVEVTEELGLYDEAGGQGR